MATLGTVGMNRNFAPGITVPGTMTLDGYVAGQSGATRLYRSVDIKRVIPKAKMEAVRTVVAAAGAKIQFRLGGWPMDATAGAGGFRLYLQHPARNVSPPLSGANVGILLADIETAVTA